MKRQQPDSTRTSHSSPCPVCLGGPCVVTDSRPVDRPPGASRRRRYRCTTCGHRFSTLEYEKHPDDTVMQFLELLDAAATEVFGERWRMYVRNRHKWESDGNTSDE